MTSKVIISIIVLLAIVVGAWYFVGRSASPKAAEVPVEQQTQQAPPAPTPEEQAAAAAKDTSDATIDADLGSIDTQATAAADAQASAGSFSDTPVKQTE